MLKYKNMEWTREKTMALINEYRKRRELWDMTHDDYRKKEQKQKYLIEVSKTLNVSILEIEKKFHTLRTQYHREVNRMKRKENYNSKWFGFKQLQFLSSPKACRGMTKNGRIKSEITEDGTVTTKFIISEHVQDNSAVSVQSSSSTIADEFLTIHRKPSNIALHEDNTAQPSASNVSSRSHELEKLIEETTKDVQYIEDSKPKITIKEIRADTMETQNYEGAGTSEMDTDTHTELHASEHESQEQQQHHHHHHHHHTQDQHTAISTENVNPLAIEIQGADGEITYHQAGNSAQASTIHNLPRIIKIQRRDTMAGQDDDYYQHHHHQQHTGQQQEQHMHSLPPATKRIYYGANGQHTATIIAPTTPPSHQSNGSSLLPNSAQHRNSLVPPSPTSSPSQQQTITRDEFSTYGEYVANEMRNLTNREILIALKHKINTALFEASMAELQK